MTQAVQTPLIDLLCNIPLDARLIYEHSPTHSQSIPVGRLAAECVAEIEALRKTIEFAAHNLEGARIWNGMEWHYNPLHPVIYLPALKRLREALAGAPVAVQPPGEQTP